MRLTSIEATDFLSFEELRLALDPGLNVVVGPNGAGKSNLVRIIDPVVNALEWSAGNAARVDTEVSRYSTSRRQGATGHGFSVRVGVELDQPWERQLIVSLVRAAAISEVLSATSDEARDGEIRQTISEDSLQAFFRGKLAVTFDAGPGGGWEVGYEFDHLGTGYCCMLRGLASDSQIVSGRLAPGRSHARGGPTLISRLLPNGYDKPVLFDLATWGDQQPGQLSRQGHCQGAGHRRDQTAARGTPPSSRRLGALLSHVGFGWYEERATGQRKGEMSRGRAGEGVPMGC